MPPFLMAGARFLLAGTILSFLRLRGAAWRPHQWPPTRSSARFFSSCNGAVVWAEQYVPSGLTALLIGVSPLFMVLTEWAWPGGTRPDDHIRRALLASLASRGWRSMGKNAAHGGLTSCRRHRNSLRLRFLGHRLDLLPACKARRRSVFSRRRSRCSVAVRRSRSLRWCIGDFAQLHSTPSRRARGSPSPTSSRSIARRIFEFVWLMKTQHAGARVDLRLR